MQAVIEVIAEIDDDQLDELLQKGEKEADIDKRIRNAVTLRESCIRQPVNSISEVRVVKYLD